MNWRERYAEYRHRFAEGMDPRFFTIEYLDWLLENERAWLWFSENAAIVCEIKAFPTGLKVVCGLVSAGEPREIVEILIPQAEHWGKANGCAIGMIESRPAWAKIMKQHGYEVFQVSIAKEL